MKLMIVSTCATCEHCQVDRRATETARTLETRADRKNQWLLKQCTNRRSPYYSCLMNIDKEGKQVESNTWCCECYEPDVDKLLDERRAEVKAKREKDSRRMIEQQYREIGENKGWRALYDMGLGDIEIAKYIDMSVRTVRNRRLRAGLPINPNKQQRVNDKRRLLLYRQGMTDSQIAKALGHKVGSIKQWREIKDLPPNKEATE